jgi:RNA polymerase sigma-70 factor (ECF subfamily)
MPPDEAGLLARANRGDPSAFAALYEVHERDLYRFAFYLTGSPDAAEELYQDTWLRVARHLGRKPIADFKRWLFTIATNLHRDELRKRKVRRLFLQQQSLEDDHVVDPDARLVSQVHPEAERLEAREALNEALSKLSRPQREVFVLIYVQGFKIREVSVILDKPDGTVKSTLHRAIQVLRDELKEFQGGL